MSKELAKKPLTEISDDQLDQVTGGTNTQDIKQITKEPSLKSANSASNTVQAEAGFFSSDQEKLNGGFFSEENEK